MKVYSNEQTNYLKSIVETEMFHMGRIKKFEQFEDNQFLLKVSENKCEYTCLVEYDYELSSFVLVIKSAFGRTVLKRWLSIDVFPVQQVDKSNLNEIFLSLEDAAIFENIKYKTLQKRIYRDSSKLVIKKIKPENGGQNRVFILLESLSDKAKRAYANSLLTDINKGSEEIEKNEIYWYDSSVNERIKEVRKNLKLTQEQFVKEIGISQSHLSSIESGKENPSVILIKLISIKHNISETWLNSGVGSPDTYTNDYVSKGVMLKHIEDMYTVLDEMKNMLLSDNRTFNI